MRSSAISPRANQASGAGLRLRAAARPSGIDSATPNTVGQHRDLQALDHAGIEQLQLVAATTSGGNIRDRKRAP